MIQNLVNYISRINLGMNLILNMWLRWACIRTSIRLSFFLWVWLGTLGHVKSDPQY